MLDAIDQAARILAAKAAVLFVMERDAIAGALIAQRSDGLPYPAAETGPLSPPVMIQSGFALPMSMWFNSGSADTPCHGPAVLLSLG